MDAAQARTFLEAAHEDRFYALYLIALTLGLRKGELLALRWQDVDLDKATLSVNGSMQRIDGKEVRVETKTAHSNRTLRLTPQIVDALKVRRDVQQFEAHIDEGWQDTGYIFTSRFGTSAGRENILTYFQAILKGAGLPKVTLHSLRHSAATLALMSGVPIHVVSRMLGHASIVITLNRYAHLMPALEEQAVDILATMYA
jgi:integrase